MSRKGDVSRGSPRPGFRLNPSENRLDIVRTRARQRKGVDRREWLLAIRRHRTLAGSDGGCRRLSVRWGERLRSEHCRLAQSRASSVRKRDSWKKSSLAGNGERSARISARPKRFAALEPEKVQKSEEIYLLAAGSDANVKIRDGLLDIKLLEHVDANGLEQWRPVLKEPFPLTALGCQFGQVRASACRKRPRVADSLSLEQLLAEVAPPGGPFRSSMSARPAPDTRRGLRRRAHRRHRERKEGANRRHRGCRPGQGHRGRCAQWGSTAIPTPATPAGLKQVIGSRPARHTGNAPRRDRRGDEFGQVSYRRAQCRRNLDDGRLIEQKSPGWAKGSSRPARSRPEAMERTAAAIAGMKDGSRPKLGVAGITAVGTMGLRTATNSRRFPRPGQGALRSRDRGHLGRGGSAIAYLAVRSGIGLVEGTLVIFDTGGGSSQFTFGHGKPGRPPVQRERRCRALHRAIRARRGGLARRVASKRLTRSPPICNSLDGVQPTDAWSGWGARSPTSPP